MRRTTAKLSNIITPCPAPRWFMRLKKAISRASNTAVIVLLFCGYSEDSLAILIVRVVVSGALDFLEALLTDTAE